MPISPLSPDSDTSVSCPAVVRWPVDGFTREMRPPRSETQIMVRIARGLGRKLVCRARDVV
jgi:hypothetical protein